MKKFKTWYLNIGEKRYFTALVICNIGVLGTLLFSGIDYFEATTIVTIVNLLVSVFNVSLM